MPGSVQHSHQMRSESSLINGQGCCFRITSCLARSPCPWKSWVKFAYKSMYVNSYCLSTDGPIWSHKALRFKTAIVFTVIAAVEVIQNVYDPFSGNPAWFLLLHLRRFLSINQWLKLKVLESSMCSSQKDNLTIWCVQYRSDLVITQYNWKNIYTSNWPY